MKLKYFVFYLLVSCAVNIFAYEFTVKSIKVYGLQKVDEGVVLNALPFEPGSDFDTNEVSSYIKSIYKTGYFKSITINEKDKNVYIYVTEKPSIASIKILGNDSFESEKLDKALEDIGIKEGGTYDEFTLERLTKELENQYLSQGKYSVKINNEVKVLERNRVAIEINISEGKAAKIKHIKIIGNDTFSSAELTENFNLTEGNLLSWVTFSDRYSKQKLAGDLEKLKSFYLDRGYLNFKIKDAQISITPDKKYVYITIEINEGEVYKYNNINLGGRGTTFEKDLNKLITIKPGDTYSERQVSNVESALLSEIGRSGYLYGSVDVNKDINYSSKTVNVTYFVNPGKRVYVRRIIFEGNIRTQDQVLRREVLQMEGAFVSKEKIELSKQRLAGLGYIKDINVETIPVQGSDDQVDLKYTMSEASTGHFNGSVGYMEKEGFMFNVGVSQDNFLGTGKSTSVNFNKSSAVTTTNVSYFDPYFTIDGIGLGYNVFYSKSKLKEIAITNYNLDVYGFDLSLRVPTSLFDLVTVTGGAQNKKIHLPVNPAYQLSKFRSKHGDDFDLFPLGASWVHSELDRALFPTSGWKSQLSGHIMLPGSDLNYYMGVNSIKYYKPLYGEFILNLRSNLAYGAGYNSDSELPFFEHYFAGGAGSVRGFEQNSLGPLDSYRQVFGGNALLTGTVELFVPKMFAPNIAWRPSVFLDAGNIYKRSIKFNKLRVSSGVAVQWLSPMGPLSVSYALPLNKFRDDQLKPFNFNIGTTF